MVVNLENPVKDLTTDQIASIFKGEITNWSELGGNDEEILIISREAGSGTRAAPLKRSAACWARTKRATRSLWSTRARR